MTRNQHLQHKLAVYPPNSLEFIIFVEKKLGELLNDEIFPDVDGVVSETNSGELNCAIGKKHYNNKSGYFIKKSKEETRHQSCQCSWPIRLLDMLDIIKLVKFSQTDLQQNNCYYWVCAQAAAIQKPYVKRFVITNFISKDSFKQ